MRTGSFATSPSESCLSGIDPIMVIQSRIRRACVQTKAVEQGVAMPMRVGPNILGQWCPVNCPRHKAQTLQPF